MRFVDAVEFSCV